MTYHLAFERGHPVFAGDCVCRKHGHLSPLRVEKDELPARRGSEVERGLVVELVLGGSELRVRQYWQGRLISHEEHSRRFWIIEIVYCCHLLS